MSNKEVSWSKFNSDIKAEMKRRLGDDIEITHCPNCDEWEIQRKVKAPEVMQVQLPPMEANVKMIRTALFTQTPGSPPVFEKWISDWEKLSDE